MIQVTHPCPNHATLVIGGRRPLRPAEVALLVGFELGLEVCELASRSRGKRILAARRVVCWLCRQHTIASFPEIAQDVLGRANRHASAHDACKAFEARRYIAEPFLAGRCLNDVALSAMARRQVPQGLPTVQLDQLTHYASPPPCRPESVPR